MKGSSGDGRWLTLAACSAGFFMANIHRISPGVFAAELMSEFNTSASLLGLLSASYFYTYAILQIPVGMLCDRFKPGLVASFFLLAGAAGSAIFAASTSLEMAVAGRVLLSAGVSAMFIAGVRIFGYAFKGGGFALATGVMVAVGNLGGVSAQGPLAIFVTRFGWRESMYVIAAITVAVAAAVGLASGKYGKSGIRGSARESSGGGFSLGQGRRDYMIMLYGLSLAALLQYGSQMGFQGLWGIPFLTDVYGHTKTAASGAVMFASIGAMIGSPLTGWLMDNRGFSAQKLTLWSAIIFMLSWTPLAWAIGSGSLVPIAVGSFFLGGGGVMMAIINPTYAEMYIADDSRGQFMGILNSASMWGGAIFQPVMGMLIDSSVEAGKGLAAGYFSSFRLGLAAAALVLAIRTAMFLRYRGLDGLRR